MQTNELSFKSYEKLILNLEALVGIWTGPNLDT